MNPNCLDHLCDEKRLLTAFSSSAVEPQAKNSRLPQWTLSQWCFNQQNTGCSSIVCAGINGGRSLFRIGNIKSTAIVRKLPDREWLTFVSHSRKTGSKVATAKGCRPSTLWFRRTLSSHLAHQQAFNKWHAASDMLLLPPTSFHCSPRPDRGQLWSDSVVLLPVFRKTVVFFDCLAAVISWHSMIFAWDKT